MILFTIFVCILLIFVKMPAKYSGLKPGDAVPGREGYIMGFKRMPVKKTSMIGRYVLWKLEYDSRPPDYPSDYDSDVQDSGYCKYCGHRLHDD